MCEEMAKNMGAIGINPLILVSFMWMKVLFDMADTVIKILPGRYLHCFIFTFKTAKSPAFARLLQII
jgi:hypothetical protein